MARSVFRDYDQAALDAEYNNREVFEAVKVTRSCVERVARSR